MDSPAGKALPTPAPPSVPSVGALTPQQLQRALDTDAAAGLSAQQALAQAKAATAWLAALGYVVPHGRSVGSPFPPSTPRPAREPELGAAEIHRRYGQHRAGLTALRNKHSAALARRDVAAKALRDREHDIERLEAEVAAKAKETK